MSSCKESISVGYDRIKCVRDTEHAPAGNHYGYTGYRLKNGHGVADKVLLTWQYGASPGLIDGRFDG